MILRVRVGGTVGFTVEHFVRNWYNCSSGLEDCIIDSDGDGCIVVVLVCSAMTVNCFDGPTSTGFSGVFVAGSFGVVVVLVLVVLLLVVLVLVVLVVFIAVWLASRIES